jgi:hypothetical protein
MFGRYLVLVGKFAFRKSVLLTDRLSFLIGPLVTALLWLRGEPVPDNVAALVASATVATILAVLFLRLLAAPFFIWRDDQLAIAGLKDELARPERAGRDETHRILAQCRLELAGQVMAVNVAATMADTDALLSREFHDKTQRLLAQVSPPPAFFRLYGRYLKIAGEAAQKGLGPDVNCANLGRMMIEYLHGRKTEDDLERLDERYEREGSRALRQAPKGNAEGRSA